MSVGQWTHCWAEDRLVPCHYLPETTSTTEEIRKRLGQIDERLPLVVVTDHQLRGKGRGVHSWSDVPGSCFLSSWAWRLHRPPQHVTAAILGLSVFHACQSTWPQLAWSLKAPNDIYIGDKKVVGLLLENISAGPENHFILGIGINVLAAPPVEGAGAIADYFDNRDEIDNELRWHGFLDALFKELAQGLQLIHKHKLSPKQCRELLSALNARSGLSEPYTSVDGDGNLYTASGQKPWLQL